MPLEDQYVLNYKYLSSLVHNSDEWETTNLMRGCAGKGLRLSAVGNKVTVSTDDLAYETGFPDSFTIHVFAVRLQATSLQDTGRLAWSRFEPNPSSWTFTVFEEGGVQMKRINIRYQFLLGWSCSS